MTKPDNASVMIDAARHLEKAARMLRRVAAGKEYAVPAASLIRAAVTAVDAAEARMRSFGTQPEDYR